MANMAKSVTIKGINVTSFINAKIAINEILPIPIAVIKKNTIFLYPVIK